MPMLKHTVGTYVVGEYVGHQYNLSSVLRDFFLFFLFLTDADAASSLLSMMDATLDEESSSVSLAFG